MGRKQHDKNKKKNNNTIFFIIVAVLIVAIGAAIGAYFYLDKDKDKKELPYTELITLINEEKVKKIEMTVGSTTLKVTLKDATDEKDTKSTIVPSTQAFMELINEKVQEGKEIELIQNKQNIFITIIINTKKRIFYFYSQSEIYYIYHS